MKTLLRKLTMTNGAELKSRYSNRADESKLDEVKSAKFVELLQVVVKMKESSQITDDGIRLIKDNPATIEVVTKFKAGLASIELYEAQDADILWSAAMKIIESCDPILSDLFCTSLETANDQEVAKIQAHLPLHHQQLIGALCAAAEIISRLESSSSKIIATSLAQVLIWSAAAASDGSRSAFCNLLGNHRNHFPYCYTFSRLVGVEVDPIETTEWRVIINPLDVFTVDPTAATDTDDENAKRRSNSISNSDTLDSADGGDYSPRGELKAWKREHPDAKKDGLRISSHSSNLHISDSFYDRLRREDDDNDDDDESNSDSGGRGRDESKHNYHHHQASGAAREATGQVSSGADSRGASVLQRPKGKGVQGQGPVDGEDSSDYGSMQELDSEGDPYKEHQQKEQQQLNKQQQHQQQPSQRREQEGSIGALRNSFDEEDDEDEEKEREHQEKEEGKFGNLGRGKEIPAYLRHSIDGKTQIVRSAGSTSHSFSVSARNSTGGRNKMNTSLASFNDSGDRGNGESSDDDSQEGEGEKSNSERSSIDGNKSKRSGGGGGGKGWASKKERAGAAGGRGWVRGGREGGESDVDSSESRSGSRSRSSSIEELEERGGEGEGNRGVPRKQEQTRKQLRDSDSEASSTNPRKTGNPLSSFGKPADNGASGRVSAGMQGGVTAGGQQDRNGVRAREQREEEEEEEVFEEDSDIEEEVPLKDLQEAFTSSLLAVAAAIGLNASRDSVDAGKYPPPAKARAELKLLDRQLKWSMAAPGLASKVSKHGARAGNTDSISWRRFLQLSYAYLPSGDKSYVRSRGYSAIGYRPPVSDDDDDFDRDEDEDKEAEEKSEGAKRREGEGGGGSFGRQGSSSGSENEASGRDSTTGRGARGGGEQGGAWDRAQPDRARRPLSKPLSSEKASASSAVSRERNMSRNMREGLEAEGIIAVEWNEVSEAAEAAPYTDLIERKLSGRKSDSRNTLMQEDDDDDDDDDEGGVDGGTTGWESVKHGRGSGMADDERGQTKRNNCNGWGKREVERKKTGSSQSQRTTLKNLSDDDDDDEEDEKEEEKGFRAVNRRENTDSSSESASETNEFGDARGMISQRNGSGKGKGYSSDRDRHGEGEGNGDDLDSGIHGAGGRNKFGRARQPVELPLNNVAASFESQQLMRTGEFSPRMLSSAAEQREGERERGSERGGVGGKDGRGGGMFSLTQLDSPAGSPAKPERGSNGGSAGSANEFNAISYLSKLSEGGAPQQEGGGLRAEGSRTGSFSGSLPAGASGISTAWVPSAGVSGVRGPPEESETGSVKTDQSGSSYLGSDLSSDRNGDQEDGKKEKKKSRLGFMSRMVPKTFKKKSTNQSERDGERVGDDLRSVEGGVQGVRDSRASSVGGTGERQAHDPLPAGVGIADSTHTVPTATPVTATTVTDAVTADSSADAGAVGPSIEKKKEKLKTKKKGFARFGFGGGASKAKKSENPSNGSVASPGGAAHPQQQTLSRASSIASSIDREIDGIESESEAGSVKSLGSRDSRLSRVSGVSGVSGISGSSVGGEGIGGERKKKKKRFSVSKGISKLLGRTKDKEKDKDHAKDAVLDTDAAVDIATAITVATNPAASAPAPAPTSPHRSSPSIPSVPSGSAAPTSAENYPLALDGRPDSMGVIADSGGGGAAEVGRRERDKDVPKSGKSQSSTVESHGVPPPLLGIAGTTPNLSSTSSPAAPAPAPAAATLSPRDPKAAGDEKTGTPLEIPQEGPVSQKLFNPAFQTGKSKSKLKNRVSLKGMFGLGKSKSHAKTETDSNGPSASPSPSPSQSLAPSPASSRAVSRSPSPSPAASVDGGSQRHTDPAGGASGAVDASLRASKKREQSADGQGIDLAAPPPVASAAAAPKERGKSRGEGAEGVVGVQDPVIQTPMPDEKQEQEREQLSVETAEESQAPPVYNPAKRGGAAAVLAAIEAAEGPHFPRNQQQLLGSGPDFPASASIQLGINGTGSAPAGRPPLRSSLTSSLTTLGTAESSAPSFLSDGSPYPNPTVCGSKQELLAPLPLKPPSSSSLTSALTRQPSATLSLPSPAHPPTLTPTLTHPVSAAASPKLTDMNSPASASASPSTPFSPYTPKQLLDAQDQQRQPKMDKKAVARAQAALPTPIRMDDFLWQRKMESYSLARSRSKTGLAKRLRGAPAPSAKRPASLSHSTNPVQNTTPPPPLPPLSRVHRKQYRADVMSAMPALSVSQGVPAVFAKESRTALLETVAKVAESSDIKSRSQLPLPPSIASGDGLAFAKIIQDIDAKIREVHLINRPLGRFLSVQQKSNVMQTDLLPALHEKVRELLETLADAQNGGRGAAKKNGFPADFRGSLQNFSSDSDQGTDANPVESKREKADFGSNDIFIVDPFDRTATHSPMKPGNSVKECHPHSDKNAPSREGPLSSASALASKNNSSSSRFSAGKSSKGGVGTEVGGISIKDRLLEDLLQLQERQAELLEQRRNGESNSTPHSALQSTSHPNSKAAAEDVSNRVFELLKKEADIAATFVAARRKQQQGRRGKTNPGGGAEGEKEGKIDSPPPSVNLEDLMTRTEPNSVFLTEKDLKKARNLVEKALSVDQPSTSSGHNGLDRTRLLPKPLQIVKRKLLAEQIQRRRDLEAQHARWFGNPAAPAPGFRPSSNSIPHSHSVTGDAPMNTTAVAGGESMHAGGRESGNRDEGFPFSRTIGSSTFKSTQHYTPNTLYPSLNPQKGGRDLFAEETGQTLAAVLMMKRGRGWLKRFFVLQEMPTPPPMSAPLSSVPIPAPALTLLSGIRVNDAASDVSVAQSRKSDQTRSILGRNSSIGSVSGLRGSSVAHSALLSTASAAGVDALALEPHVNSTCDRFELHEFSDVSESLWGKVPLNLATTYPLSALEAIYTMTDSKSLGQIFALAFRKPVKPKRGFFGGRSRAAKTPATAATAGQAAVGEAEGEKSTLLSARDRVNSVAGAGLNNDKDQHQQHPQVVGRVLGRQTARSASPATAEEVVSGAQSQLGIETSGDSSSAGVGAGASASVSGKVSERGEGSVRGGQVGGSEEEKKDSAAAENLEREEGEGGDDDDEEGDNEDEEGEEESDFEEGDEEVEGEEVRNSLTAASSPADPTATAGATVDGAAPQGGPAAQVSAGDKGRTERGGGMNVASAGSAGNVQAQHRDAKVFDLVTLKAGSPDERLQWVRVLQALGRENIYVNTVSY